MAVTWIFLMRALLLSPLVLLGCQQGDQKMQVVSQTVSGNNVMSLSDGSSETAQETMVLDMDGGSSFVSTQVSFDENSFRKSISIWNAEGNIGYKLVNFTENGDATISCCTFSGAIVEPCSAPDPSGIAECNNVTETPCSSLTQCLKGDARSVAGGFVIDEQPIYSLWVLEKEGKRIPNSTAQACKETTENKFTQEGIMLSRTFENSCNASGPSSPDDPTLYIDTKSSVFTVESATAGADPRFFQVGDEWKVNGCDPCSASSRAVRAVLPGLRMVVV